MVIEVYVLLGIFIAVGKFDSEIGHTFGTKFYCTRVTFTGWKRTQIWNDNTSSSILVETLIIIVVVNIITTVVSLSFDNV